VGSTRTCPARPPGPAGPIRPPARGRPRPGRRHRHPSQACPVPAPHIKGGKTPCCAAPAPCCEPPPPPPCRTKLGPPPLTAVPSRFCRPPCRWAPPSSSPWSPLSVPSLGRASRRPEHRRRRPPGPPPSPSCCACATCPE
jgi:hypothetical protein